MADRFLHAAQLFVPAALVLWASFALAVHARRKAVVRSLPASARRPVPRHRS